MKRIYLFSAFIVVLIGSRAANFKFAFLTIYTLRRDSILTRFRVGKPNHAIGIVELALYRANHQYRSSTSMEVVKSYCTMNVDYISFGNMKRME